MSDVCCGSCAQLYVRAESVDRDWPLLAKTREPVPPTVVVGHDVLPT